MERLIELYRGDYWLIANHLLMIGVFIYACITLRKHAWPSIFFILSVLLNYGRFLWWYLALIPAAENDGAIGMHLHIVNAVMMLSLVLLYMAIFGGRSHTQYAYESDGAAVLAAGQPASPSARPLPASPVMESATPRLAQTAETAIEYNLPLIRAVARRGAVQGAVGSLAAWGVVNIGAWFLLGGENRQLLGELSNPSDGIYFVLYSGLVLGSIMLAFAALGFVTRASGTILLDGFSLIGVGLCNIAYDFVAIAALKPYGYTMEKPSPIWIMLGISQVIWGFRQFFCFSRMVTWSVARARGDVLHDARKHLQSVVTRSEGGEGGVVKASMTVNGPLGLSFLSKTTQYTGIVLEKLVIMISTKLDDCFTIDLEPVKGATFSSEGHATLRVENSTRELVWTPLSVVALKQWSGQPVAASDLQRVVKAKVATLPLLRPYLSAEDEALRATAATALPAIGAGEASDCARSLLNDPSASVVAAALEACDKMKMEGVQDQAAALLRHEAAEVRIAAARYLRTVPSDSVQTALETAADSEIVPKVKKEIAKTLKTLRRRR